MSKLGLLRTSVMSTLARRTSRVQDHALISLREPVRRFSTEAENPPQVSSPSYQPKEAPLSSKPRNSSYPDPLFETPNTGLVYGKLTGISRNTLKTDVVNMLDGCNLCLEDVKFDYNGAFTPMGMIVKFGSRQAYEIAQRVINKKGRLYKLEKANPMQWDRLIPYDGKTVLLQGIPANAFPEDVERFLSGCEYDSSSLRIMFSTRSATVRFHSQTEAMNAFLVKNKGFCQNNQVLMRVLQ